MKYKIYVKTLQGVFLTFHVDEYIIEDGFVKFYDTKTMKNKLFSSPNCEIEVVDHE